MTRSLTHYTFILSPLVFCALKKKPKEGGVCWRVYRLERFVCMCVCALLCSAQRWVCLPACLPPLLQLLVWSPSKLYDLFSQRERSKTPSDHRESSARGFNDFTTKMSAMAGAALSGTRRKRDIQALTSTCWLIHVPTWVDYPTWTSRGNKKNWSQHCTNTVCAQHLCIFGADGMDLLVHTRCSLSRSLLSSLCFFCSSSKNTSVVE